MKLIKQQLKQIIREEIGKISEVSLPQTLGLPFKYTTAEFIDALEKLDSPQLRNFVETGDFKKIVGMITNHIRDIPGRKEGTPQEKERLVQLRDELLRAVGKVSSREARGVAAGLTRHERSRARREYFKQNPSKRAQAAGDADFLGMEENQVKLTKQELKQIIREEISRSLNEEGRHMDERARFTIHDLDDVPAQLERVLVIMKEGDYDAATRRIRGIRLVVKSIVESYYAYEYGKE